MIILVSGYFLLYFSVFALMLVLLFKQIRQKTVPVSGQKVKVSILIAARNEADNIERCLKAIAELDYPSELLEVLIGDDNSTDDTVAIVNRFIAGKANFRLFHITGNIGQARGKGNVLAQLAHKAASDFLFITDADIAVPPTWINAMLSQVQPGTGIVTGITTVEGSTLFPRMQALDWLVSLGFIQIVTDLGLPVSTMGNNMLVTREAYQSSGGYENLPFSITEDIQLFNEVLKQGYGFKNVYQAEVLALSRPAETLRDFLHQRKRWLRGTVHLPLPMKLVLMLYAGFYLFLIPFFVIAPIAWPLSILALKWTCQSVFIAGCLHKIRRKTSLKDLIFFEFYQVLSAVCVLGFYLLPVKVNWKGRKY